MSKVEKREIVVPGQVLADTSYQAGDNTVKEDHGIVATKLGSVTIRGKKVSVIPYSESYSPREDDFVIGVVVGYGPNGWMVDVDTPSPAFLPASKVMKSNYDPRKDELSDVYSIGDIISTKVLKAGRTRSPLLTGENGNLGKIDDGRFLKVDVSKIPRIIGRKGSMLRVLRKGGDANVLVGQNGVIAVLGSREAFTKVSQAIKLIEDKTYAKGLTEEVAEIFS